MQLRWDNVVIVFLVCTLVLILSVRLDAVVDVLSSMEDITDSNCTPEQRANGLVPFALVALIIGSLARALIRGSK